MNTGGGGFSASQESGDVGSGGQVGGESADHVVGTGPNGDQITGDVEIKIRAQFGDAWKACSEFLAGDMADIEIHAGGVGGKHVFDDGAGDDVARRQFGIGVDVEHEAPAGFIDEMSAFAANSFRNECASSPGDIEGGGVELDHLHVLEFGAGAKSDGVPVSGGDGGIGGFAIKAAAAAGGENGLPGPDQLVSVFRMEGDGADALLVNGEQVDDEAMGENTQVRDVVGLFQEGAADFTTGGVALGMEDSVFAVAGFARVEQVAVGLIESGAPIDEVLDMLGSLSDDDFDGLGVAEAFGEAEGVGDMGVVSGAWGHDGGDPALGVGGVGIGEVGLGDEGDGGVLCGVNGGFEAGDAGADDQDVGEEVGGPAGVEVG